MSRIDNSYNHILKSIGIFGGSQAVQIITGVARTKIIAVLLGSIGFGLIGVFQNIIQLFTTIGMLGFDTGSVREIALAKSSNDDKRLYNILSVTRQWFIGIASMAMLLNVAFCYPISLWAFSDTSHALSIALLSACVLLAILTRGNIVVLQGLNHVGYMAKATIWGNIFALIVAVPLYFIFGIKGIVPALILSCVVQFVVAVYYRKKVPILPSIVSVRAAFHEGKKILQFGIAIMISAAITALVMFMIRTLIINRMSLDGAGLFQAVWTITNTYLLMVLSSMSADYFPRLSAVSEDNNLIKESINKQTYIVLLVVTPIIVGMLVFGKYVLWILYSAEFFAARELLNWQLVGTFLKVVSWPMAFLLLAKGKGRLFIFSEASFFLIYYVSTYFLFPHYGLTAAGIGYLIAYVSYVAIIMLYARYLSGYFWDNSVVRIIIFAILFVFATFLLPYLFHKYTLWLGIVLFIASCIYCYYQLRKSVDVKGFIKQIIEIKNK